MAVYIETLILYAVLFLAGGGYLPAGQKALTDFSLTAEFARIFLYNAPSLALIWYLLAKAKPLKDLDIHPGKRDLLPGFLALPGLLIIGFIIAFLSNYIDKTSAQILFFSPSTAAGWIVLSISCLSSGYLEESFFRFYLLSRREELKLGSASALVLSTALFSICHIYEGPWGFLNSVLSGTLLCFLFLRYKSLHGIAITHGLYNITAYIFNALR